MGELIVPFVASAARVNNGETCLDGMRLMADTLHPHGVKITWSVGPESAAIARKELTYWHETYGDDAIIAGPEMSYGHFDGRLSGSKEEKKQALLKLRQDIQEQLPWANLTVLAGDHQDKEVLEILEELGFEGVWGLCWEQIEIDDITDRGCPWGFYYLDTAQRLRPATGRGLIAMEWTARDLLKAFHSGNPCLYSTDVNDVARGSICRWDNIDYLIGMAENYRRNTRYNEQVFFLIHQEAHEMERHEGWLCYTDEDVVEGAIMLDKLFAHLKTHSRFVTAQEAAAAYRARNEKTASSYMLWEDTPHLEINRDYVWNTCPGPWPRTFLHYDRGAQMMFIENQLQPVCIRNYGKAWDTQDYFAEVRIPRVQLVKNVQYHWRRELAFEVNSPAAMPFGITVWDNFSLYQLGEAPGLIEGKILPHELLFLRYDLKPGKNLLEVSLIGK